MKYYNALFQAIKNEYLQRNADAIVAFSPNGFIYDEEDFDIITQENLDREKLLTKEDLSYQFNSLTSNIKSWEIDVSNNLYLKYKELIQTAALNDIDNSDNLINQLSILSINNKDTPAYKKYKQYLNKYNIATENLQNHLNNDTSLMEASEKVLWTSKIEILQNKIKIILSEWITNGNKSLINNALEEIYKENVIKNSSITLAEIKQNIEFQEKTGLNSKSDYIEMQFIPFDFTSDNSKWTHLKLDKKDLDLFSEAFKKENTITNSSIDIDDAYEKYITAVELDYCIVNVHRNWFRKEIINSSTINILNTESLFASKLIFMKNLNIDLKGFEENSNIINEGLIKFGPLILKNQIFRNINTNKFSLQPIESKKIYKSNNYKVLSKQAAIVSKPEIELKPITAHHLNLNRNFGIVKPNITAPIEIKSGPKNSTPVSNALNISTLKKIKFLPIIHFQQNDTTGNLILSVSNKKNSNTNEPNCTISIIGIGNEFIKEVVTNNDGEVIVSLPIGNYNIKIKKSGFESLEFSQSIPNSGNFIVNKVIDPTNIIYESMYLIGVCLENLKN